MEAEKDCLLQIQKEHNDQKSAWEAEKNRLLQIQTEHEHQKSACKDEKDSQLNIQKELETGLYLRKKTITVSVFMYALFTCCYFSFKLTTVALGGLD